MFLKKGFLYSVIILLVILFSINMFAGVTGKITGRVTDKQTNEGLPGVNVIIPELQVGAATDADGYYFILNVPVGLYSVTAQMITYASVIMEQVSVSADIATTANFALVPQAIQVEGVTVTAKKKLVETNVTSKRRIIDQEFLNEMTGSGVMEVVATNAGISGEGENLHVRGGRADEVGYMVDGMSITDPVNKTLGATINRNAVAEITVMTGGFSAEYGEAMSGIINIITKEGGKAFNGQLKYEGNSFLPEAMNYGDNRMEFSVGGPVISENIRFFLSGDMSSTNDWSPRFHDTPEYFYAGDSAFTWAIPTYTGTYEYDSLRDSMLWVIDTLITNYVWADSLVPYFNFKYDTLFSDSSVWVYDTTIIDSVTIEVDSNYLSVSEIVFSYPGIDTVLENRYGPDYWNNLGPAMPHHKSHEYHGQIKFTVKPTNNLKINFGGFFSHQSLQSYANVLKYNLEKFRSQNQDGYQVNSVVNWMLNERNFLTLTANYFYTSTTNAPEFFEPIYYYNDDNNLDTFVPEGPVIPEWYEFWKPYVLTDTVMFKEVPNNNDKWKYNSPWGYWNAAQYRTQYIYPNYYGSMNTRYSNYWAVKADWTSQIGRFHEFKTGFEFKRFELYQWDLYLPWDTNPFEDNYNTYPMQMAGYVQDKMEFEGMVVNLGVRFDYIASNTPYYVDPLNVLEPIYIDSFIVDPVTGDSTFVGTFANTNPDSSDWNVKIAQPKYQISPRLGISHPITETSVLHFNYGHFFQTPQMDYLFSGIGFDISKRGNAVIGDPNLGAERTVAYELGIATQIGLDMAIDFTAYYKDIFGLIGTRQVFSIPQTYYAYQNVEYGNVKGFEIAFQKGGKYFSGNIAYTLSFAKGTASSAWEGYTTNYYYSDPVTGGGLELPKIPYYLSYDQRHLLNFVLTFRMPEGELPIYADNWSLTLNNSIASGSPYTPENLKGEITGTKNSERLPWTLNSDLKFRKGFKLGPITPNVYVQVSNLFNIKNVTDVYVTTGLPDEDGKAATWSANDFPETYIGTPGYDVRRDLDGDGTCTSEEYYTAAVASYKDQINDPTNFSAPRIITIGLEFSF